MSENILKEIQKAEKAAEKIIEEARKKAVGISTRAREKAEADLVRFQENSQKRIKEFRQEKAAGLKALAETIIKDGEKARNEYKKKMEARFPQIEKKIAEMIRKELCL